VIKKLIKKWIKPNGISVLIAAQNEEKTIKMCVESFLEFGDEIIIVTNGSTDNTRDICRELVKKYSDKVQFYDKPELPDLYHNRAFALSKAKYRWVMRGDADYIAYNDKDGKYSIRNLRNRILQTQTVWPTAFWVEQVNISIDWNLTRKLKLEHNNIVLPYIAPPFNTGYMPRIYLNTPLLKFGRIGENEGVLYFRFYKQIFITQPYWFHCTLKSEEDLFLRTERRNWRKENNFVLYPTLKDYFEKKVLKEKYNNMSFNEAKEFYFKNILLKSLEKYDEKKYFPYPKRIKRILENEKKI
jgi:glycosyltransferase involved in cell wall biosynthesis